METLTKKQTERVARLLPDGKPRYVRIYDNGGPANEGTIDRYTVVFTGNYPKGKGYDKAFQVVGMSGAPFHPQGFCVHDSYNTLIDRPTYSHLGKKISFEQLPEDCQTVVLRDYKEFWSL